MPLKKKNAMSAVAARVGAFNVGMADDEEKRLREGARAGMSVTRNGMGERRRCECRARN